MTSDSLLRKALYLSYLTVGYNVVEAVVSLLFGEHADSPGLIGFGLDSIVESISGLIMVWRFGAVVSHTQAVQEQREKRAITLVGCSFIALSALTLFKSLASLALHEIPQTSLGGIVVAIASLIVMPLLYFAKRNVGRDIGSHSLQADALQTLACWMLSLALLVGLLANSLFEVWWADPVAGVVIGVYLVKEGVTVFRRRKLCAC